MVAPCVNLSWVVGFWDHRFVSEPPLPRRDPHTVLPQNLTWSRLWTKGMVCDPLWIGTWEMSRRREEVQLFQSGDKWVSLTIRKPVFQLERDKVKVWDLSLLICLTLYTSVGFADLPVCNYSPKGQFHFGWLCANCASFKLIALLTMPTKRYDRCLLCENEWRRPINNNANYMYPTIICRRYAPINKDIWNCEKNYPHSNRPEAIHGIVFLG